MSTINNTWHTAPGPNKVTCITVTTNNIKSQSTSKSPNGPEEQLELQYNQGHNRGGGHSTTINNHNTNNWLKLTPTGHWPGVPTITINNNVNNQQHYNNNS